MWTLRPMKNPNAFEELPMERLEGHTRAFMKIEDGCNRRCAYCVIPRAGAAPQPPRKASSASWPHWQRADTPKWCFPASTFSSYGRDTGTDPAEIVEKAAQVPGIRRIRRGA